MRSISPLASVDPDAELAEDVQVGPFCVVGPNVRLGAGCKLIANVVIDGHTTVGLDNVFFPSAVIGSAPQDLKYRGAPTTLEIGDNNQIREGVTIHTGTEKGGGVTRVGSNNLLMINSHIGHDVQLGNRCIIGNNALIAGHVVINDGVAMMALVGVHHYATIGELAYIGATARIHHDVPPYVKVDGADKVRGLNSVGLKRAGVSESEIACLKDVVRKLFFDKRQPFSQKLAELDHKDGLCASVRKLVDFLKRRDEGKHGRYLEGKRV